MAEAGGLPPSSDDARWLRAVYGATFCIRFGFGITLAVFTAYVTGHYHGLSTGEVGEVGIVTAAAPIGEFTTVLLSGIAADHFGRLPVLRGGMVAAAIVFAAISFVHLPAELGALNLGFGVASGAILASSLAVIGDRAQPETRGQAMGYFDAMNLLGWVLGFAAGLSLLGTLPNAALPWVFRLGALALLAGVLVVSFGVREPTERSRLPFVHLRAISEAVFRRDVLLVALPWLVIYMLIGTGLSFLSTAGSSVGLSPTGLGAAIGAAGLLLLLTQPTYGRLADRFGRFRLMVIGTVGFLGVMGSLAAAQSVGTPPWVIAALGVSALAALAYGPAALSALSDASRESSRGTTMAVYSLVINVGMILGLLTSTGLYSRYGSAGLDLFFGLIGVGLVGLTVARGQDLRTGRTPAEVHTAPPPAEPTTLAR